MLFNFLSSLSVCFLIAISILFVPPTFATSPVIKKTTLKNVPTPETTPTKEFSIKGIKFGMTERELRMTIRQSISCFPTGCLLPTSFSIGGVYSWTALLNTYKQGIANGKTDQEIFALVATPKPEETDLILINWSEKFGNPTVRHYTSSNALGAKVENYTAVWDVGTATITIEKYQDFSKSKIWIIDKALNRQLNELSDIENKQKQKDF